MVDARGKRRKRKKAQSEYFFDYSLLFIVLFLLGFGLIMIYSTSSYEASQDYGDAAYYLKKQLFASGLGLVAMAFVAHIPYTFWRRMAIPAYLGAAGLITLIIFFGKEVKGARRWLIVPGIGMSIQPAEVAKLAVIIFMATMVCKMGRSVRSMKGFLFLMLTVFPMFAMILVITKNLSSAIIVMGIAVVMVFVASPDYKKFILLGLGGSAAASAAIYLIIKNVSLDKLSFRFERIVAWLNPEAVSQGKGYQTLQALYAIGSGGYFGKGLGQSMQKLGFVPEAQNDMIFAIICEELGLFGGIAVILMFMMLIWRMLVVANNAPDMFGGMLVVGVIAHFAIQVILNVAVVTNTIPNTGISLPFISYGGSSVLFLLVEMGIVLNVARRIEFKS